MKAFALLIPLLLIVKDKRENTFKDECENLIVIENPQSYPKQIDLNFITNNLSSNIIDNKFCTQSFKFKIHIIEIKRIGKNKYNLRIYSTPKSDSVNVMDIMRYRGYAHYLMETEKINRSIKIKKIEWRFAEI